jgi:hypothetical protein
VLQIKCQRRRHQAQLFRDRSGRQPFSAVPDEQPIDGEPIIVRERTKGTQAWIARGFISLRYFDILSKCQCNGPTASQGH